MRKQFRKSNMSVDENANVFNRSNGNKMYPAQGLYEGFTIELIMSETWGMKVPNETQNAKRKGESNSSFKGYYIINGKEYPSALEASKGTGIRLKTLQRFCKLGMSFKEV